MEELLLHPRAIAVVAGAGEGIGSPAGTCEGVAQGFP
jgi:hypothetical protein